MEQNHYYNQSAIRLSDNSPLVSIILPTYNRVHTIGRAIKSIQNQTFQDFECIIVDDASSDDTQRFLQSINDQRIIIIQHDVNLGAGAARNTGIKASRGQYIAFQDSDDEWMNESLEKKINVIGNSLIYGSNVDVVFSQFLRKKGNKTTIFPPIELVSHSGSIRGNLLVGNFISTQTVLLKRQCLDEVGLFDESLPCLLDWDLWIRLSGSSKFAFVAEPLAIVNHTTNSISTTHHNLAKAYEQIIYKYSQSFYSDKKLYGKHLYRIGNLFILAGKAYRGRKFLKKAIKIDPLMIRYRISYLLSFCGNTFYRNVFNIKSIFLQEWY